MTEHRPTAVAVGDFLQPPNFSKSGLEWISRRGGGIYGHRHFFVIKGIVRTKFVLNVNVLGQKLPYCNKVLLVGSKENLHTSISSPHPPPPLNTGTAVKVYNVSNSGSL